MPSETIPTLREALAKARTATWRAGAYHQGLGAPEFRIEEAVAWAAVDQAVEALAGPDAGDGEAAFEAWLDVEPWTDRVRSMEELAMRRAAFLAGFRQGRHARRDHHLGGDTWPLN